jgi:prepilin-type N-terminal cleavage/methylation domain-containing protein
MSTKRGFTLVELLVVIAIIALLMSILMPALARVRKQAKLVICQSNLNQLSIAFAGYTGDNDGKFNRGWPPYGGEGDWWAGGHKWPYTLFPYYQDERVRFCPMATKSIFTEQNVSLWAWPKMDATSSDSYQKPEGSYGTNEWTGNQVDEEDGWERIPGANWKTIDVKGGGRIPLVMDCYWAGGFPDDTHEPRDYENIVEDPLGQPEMQRYNINRHDYSINICFVDLSVKRAGLKQLWGLKWHRLFNTNCIPPSYDWPEWMKDCRDYEL